MGGPGSFIQPIETLFDAGALGEQTDRQLLDRFTGPDRAIAELAFTVLVKRYGPIVYRVCHAILRDRHEAEDAFQATFLVLARRARGLWVRDSLEPWLLAVARRTASSTRTLALRRLARERRSAEFATSVVDDPGWDDSDAILHEELDRLPEKYRIAVRLCDLDGLTQEQAARRLGWPDGTVRSRLARGREQLRERLARRGIAPAVAFAAPRPSLDGASALLVQRVVRAAVLFASGQPVSGVSGTVMALTKGALRIMFWSKLRTTAALGVAGVLLCGTGMMGYRAMGRQQVPTSAPGQQPTKEEGPAATRTLAAPSEVESPELVELGRARVEVARKLHDAAFRLWQAGEIRTRDYLDAQKRFNDVVAEVNVKTDADRVRFFESLVAGSRQIEARIRQLHSKDQVTLSDMHMVELSRLDAEYGLAKAKLKVGQPPR